MRSTRADTSPLGNSPNSLRPSSVPPSDHFGRRNDHQHRHVSMKSNGRRVPPTSPRQGTVMTLEKLCSMSGKPELAGQTVVVIGGSSGIGLETARRARAEGADVILTARDPERLRRVGLGPEADRETPAREHP